MKYKTEIIVKLPLEDFIKKLDNLNNRKFWQRGLSSFEHISGDPGKTGSKMKLNYVFGDRTMNLVETITQTKLPHEFHANYDTSGMHNIQKNYFEETPEGHTKWVSISEFIPTTFKMRLVTLFMSNGFKKQSKQYLTDFKNFAENGTSVNDNA